MKRFETALNLYDCKEQKKEALLLHFIGVNAYNILCDKLTPQQPENKTFKEIVSVLEDHFEPKPSELVECFRFNMRRQQDGESAGEFVVALRKLAVGCEFGQYLNKALRNQFVFGLADKKLQSRLLERKDLILDDAISIVTASELAEKGGMELQNGGEKLNVNKIKKSNEFKKNSKKAATNITHENKKCFRCGNTSHLANECNYKHVTCHFCKQKGHLRKVCFKEKKQMHQIDGKDEMTVEELLLVNAKGEVNKINSKIMHTLRVNDHSINFELDTGSPVSIINVADAKRYFPTLKVSPPDVELVSYCGTSLQCMGYIVVTVISSGKGKEAKLYIVRSNQKPIVGREWLQIIKLNWHEIFNTKGYASVNEIGTKETFNKEQLIQKYPRVFSKSMGKIDSLQVRLYLKPEITPKFVKSRRVPFSMMDAVEKQLKQHIDEGLLEKVERSEWATPIVVVPKKDGSVRICGDYKVTLNTALVVDEHPLPTIEELFCKMAGGERFSKIDLTKAYLQLEVHPSDRLLLTLSTHKGLFQPTRLMYGVASAPAKFQRLMEQILGDIDGVTVFIDDIKVTAPNDEIHIQRINEILRRLEKYNMRVNMEKSEFIKDDIEYCGYVISKYGIQRMKSKVETKKNMKRASNVDEVRVFLGLINYYGRFIRNLSDIVYPLNKLLCKDAKFIFDEQCERAFQEIKQQMQSDTVLAHYEPKLKLVLAVDASPTGVGAVLSQLDIHEVERPIQFASQTLTETQQKYSQVDKEAYAIIYGVRKFYDYLYGNKVCLITDKRAMSQIFSPQKGLPIYSATRMQHYAIFLQQFNYEIKCRKSEDNANADALSRLPDPKMYSHVEEVFVIHQQMIENLPVTTEELKEQTGADKDVTKLLKSLQYGRECDSRDRFGVAQTEFSLQNGCIFRGIRVYIPQKLRERVLNELHTAHFGISKMKSLARAYVWWNSMDKEIESVVNKCIECQNTRPDPKKIKVTHTWMRPRKPFERVHADYAGPIFGKYLFVLVDAFTKWPEIHICPNMNSDTTIQKCREIFSQFGIPNVFVSDHGRQFDSKEFQQILKNNGILHKQGAPYHPATNGQAERYVQTIKNKLMASKCTPVTVHAEMSKILMAYRRAIHPATGKSPAMLMFGRQIQSRLDLLIPNDDVNNQLRILPSKQFVVGERVAVRDYLSKVKWRYGTVEKICGELHYDVKLQFIYRLFITQNMYVYIISNNKK